MENLKKSGSKSTVVSTHTRIRRPRRNRQRRLISVHLITEAEPDSLILPQRGRSGKKIPYWYSHKRLIARLALENDFDLAHWLRQPWVIEYFHEYAGNYLNKIHVHEEDVLDQHSGDDTVHLHYYDRDNPGWTAAQHVMTTAAGALLNPDSMYLSMSSDTEQFEDWQHEVRFVVQLVQSGLAHNAWNRVIDHTVLCTIGYHLSAWLRHINRATVMGYRRTAPLKLYRMRWLLLLRDAYFHHVRQLEREPSSYPTVLNLRNSGSTLSRHDPTDQADLTSQVELVKPQSSDIVTTRLTEASETAPTSTNVCNVKQSSPVIKAPEPTPSPLIVPFLKNKLAKGSALIMDPARNTFQRYHTDLLAKWGVKPMHKSSCILVPQEWRNQDPLDLMYRFSPENCPNSNSIRLSYTLERQSKVFTRYCAWFSAWPRSEEDLAKFMRTTDWPLEGSYLCHQRMCINPNHIVYESHETNVDREKCHHHPEAFRQYGYIIPPRCRIHDPPCFIEVSFLCSNPQDVT